MTRDGNPSPDILFPDLLAPLEALAVPGPVRVALSGGLDSIVLLHIAHRVFGHRPGGVSAIHVNHQLQSEAASFEALCRQTCECIGVPLDVVRVQVSTDQGSVEAAARQARYAAFSDHLGPGETLLMGHHGDDQTETLMFRFLRGSGVRGLAGMPAQRPLGRGQLVRPWLSVPRQRLQDQASEAGWEWVDDPTNADDGFDRNFLRNRILPLLRQRWPQLDRRLQATARACAETAALADQLAETHFRLLEAGPDRIRLVGFRELDMAARRNLLRWWLDADLDRSLSDDEILGLLQAGPDANPEVLAGEFALRRFQGHIYRIPRAVPQAGEQRLVAGRVVRDGMFRVCLRVTEEAGQDAPELWLSHRRGGERLRLASDRPERPLKKWLQEQQVPPWERDRLPLVLQENRLVAVADLWCERELAAPQAGNGWWLEIWRE